MMSIVGRQNLTTKTNTNTKNKCVTCRRNGRCSSRPLALRCPGRTKSFVAPSRCGPSAPQSLAAPIKGEGGNVLKREPAMCVVLRCVQWRGYSCHLFGPTSVVGPLTTRFSFLGSGQKQIHLVAPGPKTGTVKKKQVKHTSRDRCSCMMTAPERGG